jgi:hypothetical protein
MAHKNLTKVPPGAIDRAVTYLAQAQHPDGGFDSFSSPSASRFEKTFTYQTTFVPSLILGALNSLETQAGRRLKRRLAGFIKAQANPNWSFNYWAKSSSERSRRPYPDDLDDTCCALVGLLQYDASAVGPEVLAAFVKLLLATETRTGGPYKTWLVPRDSPAIWQDTDLAVNANIAYLLSFVSQPLPNVTDYIEKAIREEQLISPYYVSTYPLIYYLSRAYDGPLSRKLLAIARQLQAQDSNPTPLKNALLLTSLLRLGDTDTASLASSLLAAQQSDGAWAAEAFCLDPARDAITYYNGCESLTTALAVEALELYQHVSGRVKKTAASDQKTALAYISQRPQVLADARRSCKNLESDLRSSAVGFLEKLGRSSIGTEIIDLPQAFNQSLKKPLGETYQPLLKQLSLANLYGWAAYTIFDDFLDEEGQPDLLPVATLSLRYSVAEFAGALPEDSGFQELVKRIFDTIDSANAWELEHCRGHIRGQQLVIGSPPDYGDLSKLAERSLGHSLTPLAILRASGFDINGRLFRGVQQALKHYLIARQLNDDIHDWQTDLQNGQITYVVAEVLAGTGTGLGSYSWPALLPLAQGEFWHNTLPQICQTIRQQTALSRRSLKNLPEIKLQNVIKDLLDKIDSSVEETLAAQDQAAVFLKHYKHNQTANV